MTRRPNWERQFYAVLHNALSRPMAYGQHDCGLFVADCIEALTGADLGADLRGTYKTRREALQVCEAHGGLVELVSRLLGPPQPPAAARRGDPVAMYHPRFGVSLGVSDGGKAAFLGPAGLRLFPRRLISMTWPV